MAEPDLALLAIEVDTDNYASTLAADTPTDKTSRTHQSEADFLTVKASYTAKHDDGNLYAELLRTVPSLSDDSATSEVKEKQKLGKKEQALFGYAVGELYYDREYERIIEVCERVKEMMLVDKRLEKSLAKWSKRAEEKIAERNRAQSKG